MIYLNELKIGFSTKRFSPNREVIIFLNASEIIRFLELSFKTNFKTCKGLKQKSYRT
jgi:hypothetical protein